MNSAPNAGICLEYTPVKLVERDETRRLHDIATNLVAGRVGDLRAVALACESGAGKTWFLRHLAEVGLAPNGGVLPVGKGLSDLPKLHALYLDLRDWPGVPEAVTRALIIAISHQVAAWMGTIPTGTLGAGMEAPLDDLSRWLEADVRQSVRQEALVLLVDQVYESSWSLLALLDYHLLGPIAAIPRTLIVLAGRGRGYPWASPELRLHCEEISLTPFDVEQTREQLRKQISEEKAGEAKIIHGFSGGYPRSNYAIALLGPDAGLEAEVQMLLETAPAERRRQVREYLEALCVLRAFDDDRIPPMLTAYYDAPVYKRWSYQQAAEVRRELVGYAFATWDEAAGGWVLGRSVRFPLDSRLKKRKTAVWQRLHAAAFCMYDRWATDYPAAAATWRPEADYHAKLLRRAGFDPPTCPDAERNPSRTEPASTAPTPALQ